MRGYVYRLGTFFRNLKGCMAAANRDSDTWYHLPKSRFKDNDGGEGAVESGPPQSKVPPGNYFLGSFRDCVLTAWKVSDQEYYIPKSRFQDEEYYGIAYRSPAKPGLLSKMEIGRAHV